MTKLQKGIAGLTLGALGVVFGDIGTSPLYALQALFGTSGQHLAVNQANIYGILSLIIWAVTIVVSIKYLGFIMRSNNEGEGGIMALVSLVKSGPMPVRPKWLFIFLGIIGVSLFYGDSAITPAISVLSAVEGMKVITPHLSSFIIPATLVILALLFWIQRYGTGIIGRLFGPVMLVWFVTIGLGGGWQIWQHPGILIALSPLTALQFFISQPLIAFMAMGAVVLAITGAEALYADMGHFGRAPIARAWFFLVFPALLLCYMGQGALLLIHPEMTTNPLVFLFPSPLHVPIVILATLATLIASQSVISGAFSLTRQAVQLNFLPKMLVRHTSTQEVGQIYVPFVNAVLLVAVVLLVIVFGSSTHLANAYGVAISGALLVDTILFTVVVYSLKRISMVAIAFAIIIFLPLDLLFATSNLAKIVSGGWFPIVVAIIMLTIITTWMRGRRIVTKERRKLEGPLQSLVDAIHTKQPPIVRIPGQAIYISHHPDYAPLALHAAVEQLKELHERVVIISVQISASAHIRVEERAVFDALKYKGDNICHLSLVYGFHDVPNVPKTLRSLRGLSPELDFDSKDASYFVSLSKVVPTSRHNLSRWRKSLYLLMSRNARSTSDYYRLPIDQTVEIQSLIKL